MTKKNAGQWRALPAEGRTDPAPEWPIRRPSKAVRELWVSLWATPQAVVWAELGWTRVVARYALLVVAAESEDASASLLAEVRQMEDRLGLNPIAMRKLYWLIDEKKVEQVEEEDDRDNVTFLYGSATGA